MDTTTSAGIIATQESLTSELLRHLEATPDPAVQTLVAEGIRKTLEERLWDPYEAVRHYLFRLHEQKDGGSIHASINANPKSLGINQIRRSFEELFPALSAIFSGGDLSCEKHGSIYAGGFESQANRIYTPQEIASRALTQASYRDGKRILPEPKGGKIVTGSIEEAAELLNLQFEIAKVALETIVRGELSCQHEAVKLTDGSIAPTAVEVAITAYTTIREIKLTGSPVAE